jgi:hypothetical protein
MPALEDGDVSVFEVKEYFYPEGDGSRCSIIPVVRHLTV